MPLPFALFLAPIVLNLPLIGWWAYQGLGQPWLWLVILLGVLAMGLWGWLHVAPIRDGVPVGVRMKILGGAAPILSVLCFATVVEAIALPVTFVVWGDVVPMPMLITNLVWALAGCLLLYLNGALRAVLLSKSLTAASKIFLLATLWIPLIGWLAGIAVARTVRREHLAAVDRVEWERALPVDDRCDTRFPILLVHGIGWRDRERFNAWGRIPKYLARHGAKVFHGGQEAWGAIDANAQQLVTRVGEVLAETGAGKVNIIAHSRGGIDSRYAISSLGLGPSVASLTTMNTPHHGVRFADSATKLTEPVYRRLAATVNWVSRISGDTTPDFQSSTLAFRTERAIEFNRANPDDPDVMYQSYTSVMSSAASDRWLSVPYRVIKALGEDNDGLVSVDSAKWGDFRGVFSSTSRRGVGHGDLVDMNREDFRGFNVLDAYITIVAELKERGY